MTLLQDSWWFTADLELTNSYDCEISRYIIGDRGTIDCGWNMIGRTITDKSYKLQYKRDLNSTSKPVDLDSDYFSASLIIGDILNTEDTATFKT